MKNLNKKQNLVEQARINLDKEKLQHQITQCEVERLHSIIKEAREYIEKNKRNLFLDVSEDFLDHDELVDRRIGKELLEILDKVEENK